MKEKIIYLKLISDIVSAISDNNFKTLWFGIIDTSTDTNIEQIVNNEVLFSALINSFIKFAKTNLNPNDHYSLNAMHNIVAAMNNENAYFNRWIYLIPDGADEDELNYIENDKDSSIYKESIELFISLCHTYLKDGLYIGKSLYL